MLKRNLCLLLTVAISSLLAFTACMKPRVELDRGAWGDKAQIIGVTLFRFVEVRGLLNYKDSVTGYQMVTVKTGVTINNELKTVAIVADSATNIAAVGLRISHYADKIVPQQGAPAAGYISDFTKGAYVYKLYSADGTQKDWTLTFSVSPRKL